MASDLSLLRLLPRLLLPLPLLLLLSVLLSLLLLMVLLLLVEVLLLPPNSAQCTSSWRSSVYPMSAQLPLSRSPQAGMPDTQSGSWLNS